MNRAKQVLIDYIDHKRCEHCGIRLDLKEFARRRGVKFEDVRREYWQMAEDGQLTPAFGSPVPYTLGD